MKKVLLKIVSALLTFSLTFVAAAPVLVSAKNSKKTVKDNTVSKSDLDKRMKKHSEKYLDF